MSTTLSSRRSGESREAAPRQRHRSRPSERAFREEPRECGFVDNRAARGIHQDTARYDQAQARSSSRPRLSSESLRCTATTSAASSSASSSMIRFGPGRAFRRERRTPCRGSPCQTPARARRPRGRSCRARRCRASCRRGCGRRTKAIRHPHRLVGLRDAPHHREHQAEGELDRRARDGAHRLEVRRGHADQTPARVAAATSTW